MPTLPNMSLILPTLGGDSGTWDDKLNAALTLVDAHDHTSGKGISIKTAAISIDADLSFGGYGATALGKAAFSAVTALSAGSKTLFVSSADNELYWRTNAGTNVKLTSGTTINVSLVGGIVGDYSSVGAEVAYDDANSRYTFKQQGTKPWARIASGPVRIYEFNTTETVYVELAVDAALAASYTLTLPAALPGAATIMQVSAAGVVSFSNSLTGNVSTTGSVSATDHLFTTVKYKRLPTALAHANTSNTDLGFTMTGNGWSNQFCTAAATSFLYYPTLVDEGDTIAEWSVSANKASNAATTITASLYKQSPTGGLTLVGSSQTNSANAPGAITLSATGLTELVGTNSYILVVNVSSICGDVIYPALVGFKRV